MKIVVNKPAPVVPPKTYDILGLTAGQFLLIADAIAESDGYADDAAGCSDAEGMALHTALEKIALGIVR